MISMAISIVCVAFRRPLLALIFGFHMGVAGAAYSTLVSRIFCMAVVFVRLRQPRQMIVINDLLKIRPEGALIKKILAIGIPSGIENGMFQFGKLAMCYCRIR